MASIYAFGKDPDEIKDIVIDLSWRDITSLSPSSLGLLSNKKIRKLVKQYFGEANIEESKIPLSIIATNITNGEKVVLENGNLAKSIAASMSIPGIFKPVELNGDLLVDGGVVENVPVSPLQKSDIDFVIAVDLTGKRKFEKPKNFIGVLTNSFHHVISAASKFQISNADLIIEPDLSDFNQIDTSQALDLVKKGYEEAMKTLTSKIE